MMNYKAEYKIAQCSIDVDFEIDNDVAFIGIFTMRNKIDFSELSINVDLKNSINIEKMLGGGSDFPTLDHAYSSIAESCLDEISFFINNISQEKIVLFYDEDRYGPVIMNILSKIGWKIGKIIICMGDNTYLAQGEEIVKKYQYTWDNIKDYSDLFIYYNLAEKRENLGFTKWSDIVDPNQVDKIHHIIEFCRDKFINNFSEYLFDTNKMPKFDQKLLEAALSDSRDMIEKRNISYFDAFKIQIKIYTEHEKSEMIYSCENLINLMDPGYDERGRYSLRNQTGINRVFLTVDQAELLCDLEEKIIKILTARGLDNINEAVEKGYTPLVKKVYTLHNKEVTYVLDRDLQTGKFIEQRGIDNIEKIQDNMERVIEKSTYCPYKFNESFPKYLMKSPYAAYLIPKDIEVGQKVLIIDVIDDCYLDGKRISSAFAIWNGQDLDIDFSVIY